MKKTKKIWRPLNTWGLVVIATLVALSMACSIVAISP